MLSRIRGLLRRNEVCRHEFGDWRYFRSRALGWRKIRYCARCGISEVRPAKPFPARAA
ncbi:MAG: hypothetical protein QJR02_01610 [Sinobacteraceae bacterium]|nr:hypothetical protein [Nevskiaceae bacterium]